MSKDEFQINREQQVGSVSKEFVTFSDLEKYRIQQDAKRAVAANVSSSKGFHLFPEMK